MEAWISIQLKIYLIHPPPPIQRVSMCGESFYRFLVDFILWILSNVYVGPQVPPEITISVVKPNRERVSRILTYFSFTAQSRHQGDEKRGNIQQNNILFLATAKNWKHTYYREHFKMVNRPKQSCILSWGLDRGASLGFGLDIWQNLLDIGQNLWILDRISGYWTEFLDIVQNLWILDRISGYWT